MDEMTSRTPNFQRKLDLLLRLKRTSQSELARRVSESGTEKVTPQAISRYVAGASPSPDTARRIARVLQVDPLWLIDESQPITVDEQKGIIGPIPGPFEYVNQHVREVSTERLSAELGHRYRECVRPISAALDRAEHLDWQSIAKTLASVKSWEDASPVAREAVRFAGHTLVALRQVIRVFDFGILPKTHNGEVISEDEADRADDSVLHLLARYHRMLRPVYSNDASCGAMHEWFRGPGKVTVAETDEAVQAVTEAIGALAESVEQK
mgnify:CR=1 FL=1